jgi:hypothetical protein
MEFPEWPMTGEHVRFLVQSMKRGRMIGVDYITYKFQVPSLLLPTSILRGRCDPILPVR